MTRDCVAGRLLQQKLEWIRKASWSSRPTGLRRTSPTTPPGTTDPSSFRSSIRPPPTSPSLRSLWQRRLTTRSWTLCRTQPSQIQRTPQLGFTMHGWLDGVEVLWLLSGFLQVSPFLLLQPVYVTGDGVVSVATNQKIEAADLTTWVGGQEKRLEWEATSRFSNLWRAKLSQGSLFEAALGPEAPRFALLLRI